MFDLQGHAFSRADLEHMMHLGFKEDEIAILSELEDPRAAAESGFIVDRYGIRTRTTSLWPAARALDGSLSDLPVPGNFHWETIEWLGVMRSVLEASDSFRVMELGAGWGPAIVSASVLARLRGLTDIRMTGVEGDPHHYGFMVQHVRDNGFDPALQRLHQAAIAVRDGVAHWPVTQDSSGEYGFRPMVDGSDYMGRVFAEMQEVRLISLKQLVLSEQQWDLIHIDIQGSEIEVCASALPELTARARRIMIGTHSRRIEGDLLSLFGGAGWILENEKPCKFDFQPGYTSLEAMTTVDGTQTWRNSAHQLPQTLNAATLRKTTLARRHKLLDRVRHSLRALKGSQS